MELFISNVDLFKASKKYEFDMADISEQQWLKFGEEFLKLREEGNEQEFEYMIENSALCVKFREHKNPSTAESMIAKVNLEYLRENDECISLNYNFDVNGELSNPSSEMSRCWRSVMLDYNKANNL